MCDVACVHVYPLRHASLSFVRLALSWTGGSTEHDYLASVALFIDTQTRHVESLDAYMVT